MLASLLPFGFLRRKWLDPIDQRHRLFEGERERERAIGFANGRFLSLGLCVSFPLPLSPSLSHLVCFILDSILFDPSRSARIGSEPIQSNPIDILARPWSALPELESVRNPCDIEVCKSWRAQREAQLDFPPLLLGPCFQVAAWPTKELGCSVMINTIQDLGSDSGIIAARNANARSRLMAAPSFAMLSNFSSRCLVHLYFEAWNFIRQASRWWLPEA